jgi:hypothetical protein
MPREVVIFDGLPITVAFALVFHAQAASRFAPGTLVFAERQLAWPSTAVHRSTQWK